MVLFNQVWTHFSMNVVFEFCGIFCELEDQLNGLFICILSVNYIVLHNCNEHISMLLCSVLKVYFCYYKLFKYQTL